jgi:hypothetical protein
VIVYEKAPGTTVVAAIDPDSMVAVVGDNQAVIEVARDARARLQKALADI